MDEGIEANEIAKPSYQLYQNYQNGSLNNHLTHGGKGGEGNVLGATKNLFMCDMGGALYSVYKYATVL
jgi:hypothetical protein